MNDMNVDINAKEEQYFESIIKYKRALFQLDEGETREQLQDRIDSIEYREYDKESIKQMRIYKNQVRKYVRSQLENPSEVLDPKSFITTTNPIKESKLKILNGTMEIANQANVYTTKLREMGYQAFSLNYYPTYLKYDADFVFNIWSQSYDRERLINIVSYMISEFDIFHFHFGTSLMLNNEDLPLLKRLNKKVVMHHWGSDVRTFSKALEISKYVKVKNRNEDEIKRKLKLLSKYISHCIVSDYEMFQYVNPYYEKIYIIPQAIDIKKYSCKADTTKDTKDKKLLIVHAPTSPLIKGSDYIIAAINELKQKYDFDFQLIRGMLHEEAKSIYSQADLIIDQLLIGSHGLLAVEAMAMGKPVICWISDFMKDKYPDNLPIISANPENIKTVLEGILINPNSLSDLGQKGRRYVESQHNIDKIGMELLKVYNKL